ncbi:hypothetical protein ACP70R_035013 [Stipagrostis hirtigluma subsp. patula]
MGSWKSQTKGLVTGIAPGFFFKSRLYQRYTRVSPGSNKLIISCMIGLVLDDNLNTAEFIAHKGLCNRLVSEEGIKGKKPDVSLLQLDTGISASYSFGQNPSCARVPSEGDLRSK